MLGKPRNSVLNKNKENIYKRTNNNNKTNNNSSNTT